MSRKDESQQEPISVSLTPSTISLPSNGQQSLPQQINASSTSTHSKLNRLIIARLPLALPPQTTDPSIYIAGLLHIAPIYITFESLWTFILEIPHLPITQGQSHASDTCKPKSASLEALSAPIIQNISNVPLKHPPRVCTRMHALLAHLRLPGLLRAGRLRADIRSISGMSDPDIDEQVERASRTGKIAEFIAHMQLSIEANPHVILAYAWVLYMALFSGGRFIRKSLQAAGPEFWMELTHRCIDNNNLAELGSIRQHYYRSDPTMHGIQFLGFDGDDDGEDIKLEFKKRIAEAEIILTDEEKSDIVEESQQIFKHMVEIVPELDAITENAGIERAAEAFPVLENFLVKAAK